MRSRDIDAGCRWRPCGTLYVRLSAHILVGEPLSIFAEYALSTHLWREKPSCADRINSRRVDRSPGGGRERMAAAGRRPRVRWRSDCRTPWPRKGLRYGYALNKGDVEQGRARDAVAEPARGRQLARRQARAGVLHRGGVFRDQCFAVAMRIRRTRAPGVGWAIGIDKKTASRDALVKLPSTPASLSRRDVLRGVPRRMRRLPRSSARVSTLIQGGPTRFRRTRRHSRRHEHA